MGIRTLSMKDSFTCAKFLIEQKMCLCLLLFCWYRMGGGVNLQICFLCPNNKPSSHYLALPAVKI